MFITVKLRHRAASLALLATVILTGLKLGIAYLSHSVGLLSEGIHSFLDLVSAAMSFFTVKEAGKPADRGHPFGHGKIETLSSLFESLMLILAAGLIVYEGVAHLIHPEPLSHGWLAIVTIIASVIISYWVYHNNLNAAEVTESSALHVNALHFLSDVVASMGVLAGLLIIQLTNWFWIDSAIAFAVAAYILSVSIEQVKKAILELSDTSLPAEDIQKIQACIDLYKTQMIGAHDLRTRKSGAARHVDFHLVVCRKMSVENSHWVCDQIETEILKSFPQASVNIHVEPCEQSCLQHVPSCANDRK